MEETIGTLRHENTAMKADIGRLRTSQVTIPHTSTATAEVNMTETSNADFPLLTAAVRAPINGPATIAMAVKRHLPVTKLNDSNKSKPTTLREQAHSYQPKLRTSEAVPLYFRVSRGPISAIRRSLGTVLLRGSMINLRYIGRETLEIL